jgi:hypothetical protein
MNDEQLTTILNELITHFNELIVKCNLDWKDEVKILQKLTQVTSDKLAAPLTIVSQRRD